MNDVAGTAYPVLALGADPSGKQSSSYAIAAAVNEAFAQGLPEVVVPAGRFLCGALVLPPGVSLRLMRGATMVAPPTLATSWLSLDPQETYTDLAVSGGTWDASAATSANVFAVLNLVAASVPGLRVRSVKVISAPGHGIFASENGPYSPDLKLITRCVVDGHGLAATGFGIYLDYIGNIEISRCYVTAANADDAIELGHSGPAWLSGLNARMTARANLAVNGQIQFPHSDNALIADNTVVGNTIQNDNHAAAGVTIVGNTVLGAVPAFGYAGICIHGTGAIIGNNVSVVSGSGIQAATQEFSGVIAGNNVTTTATISSPADVAIGSGGTSTPSDVIIASNVATGAWTQGVQVAAPSVDVAGNILALDGATEGVIVEPGNVTGYNSNDVRVIRNRISGATSPVVGPGGTATGFVARDNEGYNPAAVSTPAVPSASTSLTNTTGVDCDVYIAGGTAVAVSINGTSTGQAAGTFFLPANGTIDLGPYTAAPTWVWVGR